MIDTQKRRADAPGLDGDAVLEVRHLTKRFPVGGTFNPKHVHALNDVSFTIGAARRDLPGRRVGQRQVYHGALAGSTDAALGR